MYSSDNSHSQPVKNVAALILAAGNSRRMSTPKFMLPFHSHISFLEAITKRFHEFNCDPIVIVINSKDEEKLMEHSFPALQHCTVVINEFPGKGRFYSVMRGMENIRNGSYSFLHNADNPFVIPEVLRVLWNRRDEADYICPYYKNRGGHPVLVSPLILDSIKCEKEHHFHLKEYLNGFSKLKVQANDEKILVNINTPEDFRQIKSRYLND